MEWHYSSGAFKDIQSFLNQVMFVQASGFATTVPEFVCPLWELVSDVAEQIWRGKLEP